MKNFIEKIKNVKASTIVAVLFLTVAMVLIVVVIVNNDPGKDADISGTSLQSSTFETSIESEAKESSILGFSSLEEMSKEEVSSTITSTTSKENETSSLISKSSINSNTISPTKAQPSPTPTQPEKAFDEKKVNTLVVDKMKKLKGSTTYKTNIAKPAIQEIKIPQNLKTDEAANFVLSKIQEILNYSLYLEAMADAAAPPCPFNYDYYLEFVGNSTGNHIFKLNYRLKKQYSNVSNYNTDEIVNGVLEFLDNSDDPNYASLKNLEKFDGQSEAITEPFPIPINTATIDDLDVAIQMVAGTMKSYLLESPGATKYDIEYYGKFTQNGKLALMFNLYLK